MSEGKARAERGRRRETRGWSRVQRSALWVLNEDGVFQTAVFIEE